MKASPCTCCPVIIEMMTHFENNNLYCNERLLVKWANLYTPGSPIILKSIGQLIERGITLQKPLIKVSCNSANLYSPPCAPSNKFAGVEVFVICQSVRGLSLSAHLLINNNTVRMAHKNLQKWVKLVNVISQSINYLVG